MKKVLMAAVVAFAMLFGAQAFAQDDIDNDKSFFELGVDFAAGWGSYYGEEDETLSQDAQFAAVHADVLGVNLFDTTSGVGIEVQFGGELEYQVWSLNRATVPGTDDRVYGGSDFKLVQSTDNGGAEGDFDMRVVAGYRVASPGPGVLRAETYFLEEDTPIGFALIYDFNWP